MSRPSAAPVRSDHPAGPRRPWPILPAAVAITWVGLIVLTPGWRHAAAGSVSAGAAALVDLAASRVCHRQPARSFHWHGEPLPVCGRCTGLYVSGAVGLLAASVAGGRRPGAAPPVLSARPGWDEKVWLVVAGLPTLLTWGLEVAGLWNPGTALRAAAALPLGAAVGWIVGRALASGPGAQQAGLGQPALPD